MNKMKSPNFKLSDTRVLLKNVNKTLDENDVKEYVRRVIESGGLKKEVKNKKIVKVVKILRDENKNNRSKVMLLGHHICSVCIA